LTFVDVPGFLPAFSRSTAHHPSWRKMLFALLGGDGPKITVILRKS